MTTGRHFRKRNPMRKKLVESLLAGNKLKVAAQEAGYSSIQSAQNALRFVRGEIADELKRQGWDAREIVRKCLIPKLLAKKAIFFQNGGIVTDKRTVEDTSTQLAVLDMIFRVTGAYAPLAVEHSGVIEHVLTEAERREAVESLRRIAEYSSEDAIDAELVDNGKPQ